MKRLIKIVTIISVVIIVVFGSSPMTAHAAQSDTGSEQSTEEILKEQSLLSGADKLPGKTPDSAKKTLNSLDVNGADQDSFAKFTPVNLFNTVLDSLKQVAARPFKACVGIIAVLLACAMLSTLSSSINQQSMQKVFDIVAALSVSAIILIPITQCVSYCAKVIGESSNFMTAFLPVYSSLAIASGRPASGIASQALLLVVSQVLSKLTSSVFIPMVDIYLAFCVVGSVSPSINITGAAGFMKKVVTWALTLCLTIYSGILTVQGVIASAADNLTMKAAKFVIDGAVPIIGGTISDAMNTVISCTGLLKTTVGAYAIVVFILAYLPPVLECVVWMLAIDLSLAVADILGIKNMTGLLGAIKEAIKLISALVFASALAMIISVSIMLLVGKGS